MFVNCHCLSLIWSIQACISSILTKTATEDGPCPKCKKTVRLGDLRTVSGSAAYGAKSEPQQQGELV